MELHSILSLKVWGKNLSPRWALSFCWMLGWFCWQLSEGNGIDISLRISNIINNKVALQEDRFSGLLKERIVERSGY